MRQGERRALTTRRLLDAAAEVFARLGVREATVDDVAQEAGYTKGAVYANFESKEALLLALIDRHLDGQLAAVDRLVPGESSSDLVATLQGPQEPGGEAFGVLMLEFWHYAARNEQARSAVATRYALIRSRLADAILQRDVARGASGARDPGEVASLVLALDAGLFLQGLIDPGAVTAELRADAIAELVDP